jgi:hypothetical protein
VQIVTTLINFKGISGPFKQALLCLLLMLFIMPVFAQVKRPTASRDLKEFSKELADADLNFTLPAGFKELKDTNDDQQFDYGIQLPDADFEIWFQVKSLKDGKPIKLKNDKVANPDSLYLDMGRTQAATFIGDSKYITRSIPAYALSKYNADAGKTFLLNLPDSPTTKHYKYAMVVVLQKTIQAC